jgi:hypothetical protein
MAHHLRVKMVLRRHAKMVTRMIDHLRVKTVTDLRAAIATRMIDLARAKLHPPHPHRARPMRFHFPVRAWARTACLMRSSPVTVKVCRHHFNGAIFLQEHKALP